MFASRQWGGWSIHMKRTVLMSVILAATAFSGFAVADDNDNKHRVYSEYQNNGFVRDYDDDNRYGNNRYDNDRVVNRGGAVRYDTARVLSVDPIIDNYHQQSRRECWVEPSRQYAGYRQPVYGYNDNQYNRGNRNSGNAILGGIIGGVLGNQVGKGDGRKAATVAGAVLGYAIAREVNKNNNNNNQYRNDSYGYNDDQYGSQQYGGYDGYQTEPNGQLRCRMVNDDRYDYGYQNSGYDNRYGRDRYINERYQDRYNHDRYDARYDNARVTGYRVTFEYNGQVYNTVTDYHPGNNIRVRVNVTADNNNQGYRNNEYAGY
jgi:uncharacterized protein YcfJ